MIMNKIVYELAKMPVYDKKNKDSSVITINILNGQQVSLEKDGELLKFGASQISRIEIYKFYLGKTLREEVISMDMYLGDTEVCYTIFKDCSALICEVESMHFKKVKKDADKT